MNAANIFMAVADVNGLASDEYASPLVVTSTMKEAHRSTVGTGFVQHDMKPTFHPLAMPQWRDCLTCWVCGYTLVTKRMFEQAPHWAKVYLAALYLEDWLELLEELPEGTDGEAILGNDNA